MEAWPEDAQASGQHTAGGQAAKNEAGTDDTWLSWGRTAPASAITRQPNGLVSSMASGAGYPAANGNSHGPQYMPYANGFYANGYGGAQAAGGVQEDALPGDQGAVRRSSREPKSRIILVRAVCCAL